MPIVVKHNPLEVENSLHTKQRCQLSMLRSTEAKVSPLAGSDRSMFSSNKGLWRLELRFCPTKSEFPQLNQLLIGIRQ